MTLKELEARIRTTPLQDRLRRCVQRIGELVDENRLRMSIPVAWDDDDFYFALTLRDAIDALDSHEQRNDTHNNVSL